MRQCVLAMAMSAICVAWLAAPALAGEAAPAAPVLRWQPLMEPGSGGWITSLAVSPHDPKRVLVGGDLLGIGLSEDRGESWQTTFGLPSWEIADFTFHPADPRTVWVGTMSGPCLSRDGGRTWQLRRQGFPPIADHQYSAPIQKVLFDPKDPARLVAVGGSFRRFTSPGKPLWGAVWESRDGGAMWQRLSTIKGAGGDGANILAAAFAAGSSDVLYAAADRIGPCVSTDGGRTWEVRNAGLPFEVNINHLAAHPKDAGTLWVALGAIRHPEEHEFQAGGIYKSTDAGRTWKPADKGLSAKRSRDENFTARYQAVAVSPTAPDVLLTSDTAWDGGVLYRSTDGGASWKAELRRQDFDGAYPSGLGLTVITFDPRDVGAAFAAGSEYAIRTLDGGKTWTDVTSRRAPAGGTGWRGRGYSGLCTVNFKWNPRDPRHAVILAMDHGNFWQSRDGLQSWTWGGKDMPNWGGANDVAFSGGGTMYVTLGQFGSFGGIAKTTDSGATWKILAGAVSGLPNENARAQPVGIHTLPDDPNTVWAAIGGELCQSLDGGMNWKTLHQGPGLTWIAPAPGRPRRFYVSGSEGVYRTEDGQKLELLPGSPKQAGRLVVDTSPSPRVYAVSWRTGHGGLWRLADGAWQRICEDVYIDAVAVDPTDPRRLAVATRDDPYHDVCRATGVWISSDAGATWSPQNAGLPCTRGPVIAINPHGPEQLIFGTEGLGYFTARWPKR